ncbi:LssY C-terminal domain-containing protein [Arthrobacter sp. Z1-15]
MTQPTGAARSTAASAVSPETAVDWAFFLFGGLAAGWFAVMLLDESLQPRHLWVLVIFWAVLAYLVLPRLHRVLTRIYIPDYFMGRTRTSDGLFGDPVNLAFRGQEEQLRAALEQAGWTAADPVTLASSRRIVLDSILHRSYAAAPVSPLFLFGRQQDFAYQQEIDGNPRRRHHLRFWRCPPGWLLPGGISVDWLAAAAYDRSVGLSFFTLQVTHRIGADIDAERDYVVSSLAESSPDLPVEVIRGFSTGYHSRNGGGDSFETDGDLPIVDVGRTPFRHGSPLLSPGSGRVTGQVSGQRPRRPAPVVVGAVLVFLRAAAALTVAAALLGKGSEPWRSILPQPGTADPGTIGLGINLGSGSEAVGFLFVAFACADAGLGILILRGVNAARLAAMTLSAAAIVLQIVSVVSSGPDVPLRSNLAGYSLDVLLILALSSGRAREFAHQRHRVRQRRRRSSARDAVG